MTWSQMFRRETTTIYIQYVCPYSPVSFKIQLTDLNLVSFLLFKHPYTWSKSLDWGKWRNQFVHWPDKKNSKAPFEFSCKLLRKINSFYLCVIHQSILITWIETNSVLSFVMKRKPFLKKQMKQLAATKVALENQIKQTFIYLISLHVVITVFVVLLKTYNNYIIPVGNLVLWMVKTVFGDSTCNMTSKS